MVDLNLELEEVQKQAEEKLPGFDMIIDMFDLTFAYVSERGAKMSGHTSEEMIGKQATMFSSMSEEQETFVEILRKMKDDTIQVPIKDEDGKERILSFKQCTVDVGGHPFLIAKILGVAGKPE
jgi:PAS domain S-box-containing protein